VGGWVDGLPSIAACYVRRKPIHPSTYPPIYPKKETYYK